MLCKGLIVPFLLHHCCLYGFKVPVPMLSNRYLYIASLLVLMVSYLGLVLPLQSPLTVVNKIFVRCFRVAFSAPMSSQKWYSKSLCGGLFTCIMCMLWSCYLIYNTLFALLTPYTSSLSIHSSALNSGNSSLEVNPDIGMFPARTACPLHRSRDVLCDCWVKYFGGYGTKLLQYHMCSPGVFWLPAHPGNLLKCHSAGPGYIVALFCSPFHPGSRHQCCAPQTHSRQML